MNSKNCLPSHSLTPLHRIGRGLGRLLLFAVVSSASPAGICAQETFTAHLTRRVAGEGTVILHQDAAITALVNGAAPSAATSALRPAPRPVIPRPAPQDTASLGTAPGTGAAEPAPEPAAKAGRRTYVNGFRIQVYSGGNNRKSKQEASAMAGRVRSQFPEQSVYTHFVSPHWICRVGDFRTVEEANDLMRQMRATGMFSEAIVVKSKVVVTY